MQEINVPELNDDYCKKYTDYDTVDEYRAGVRKELEEYYDETNTETARMICSPRSLKIPKFPVIRRISTINAKKNMMPTTRFLQICLVSMSLTLQAPKMTSRVP